MVNKAVPRTSQPCGIYQFWLCDITDAVDNIFYNITISVPMCSYTSIFSKIYRIMRYLKSSMHYWESHEDSNITSWAVHITDRVWAVKI